MNYNNTDKASLDKTVVILFFLTIGFMLAVESIIPKSYMKESMREKSLNVTLSIINITLSQTLKVSLSLAFVYVLSLLFKDRVDPLGVSSLPLYITIPLGVLLMDSLRYWVHRAQHTIPFLWRFHSVHHSVKTLNTLNIYRSHPVDYFLRNILPSAIVFSIGFSITDVFFSTIIGLFAMWSHSGADLKSEFWNKVFVTNEVHRWHHANKYEGIGYNFAVLFCFWDQIFGTYYLGDEEKENMQLGLKAN